MSNERKKRKKRKQPQKNSSKNRPSNASSAAVTKSSSTSPSTSPSGQTKAPPSNRSEPHDAFAPLFGGVAPSRLDAMLRLTLFLLAFDCWIDLVPHGGRYGVGDFNVAHFGILDALLPMPTPALYVGSLLFTGVLSFVMALTPWRPGLITLFITYTLGWAASMLDSYQHHYLVSLVLFSFMFFPLRRRSAAATSSAPWPVRLGGVSFAWAAVEVIGGSTGVWTPLTALVASDDLRTGLQGALMVYGLVSTMMLTPDSSGEGEPTKKAPLVSAWAYMSVCVTCAIVYFYTAINKLSPDWRDGHALRRLGRSEAFLGLEEKAAEGWAFLSPMQADAFWSLMAKGAIAVQLVSALGFLVASQQDRLSLKPTKRAMVFALGLAPLSFHLGAEAMGLEIGWFSFYMLVIVVVVFAPRPIIDASVEALGVPGRWLRRVAPKKQTSGVVALAGSVVCALLLAGVDLPGDVGAGVLLATVGLGALWATWKGSERNAAPALLGVSMVFAGIFAYVSLTESSVRYDYYRFVGGDHRRRGEPEEALAAYILANRYVVTPWCVIVEGEDPVCFRDEADADAATTNVTGATVRRSDRQEKEDEMRRLVEARAGDGS